MNDPQCFRSFDPRSYLTEYFTEVDSEFDALYRFWCRALGTRARGRRALELGVGPCLYTAIPLARRFREIHLADLLPSNLAEIESWLDRKPGHFDWSDHIARVLFWEGRKSGRREVQARARQLRARIVALRVWDLRQEALHADEGEYDLVSAHYCTEAAARSVDEWHEILGRVAGLVRPGGALLLSVAAGLTICRDYDVSASVGAPLSLGAGDADAALARAGLTILAGDFVPGMGDDPYAGSVLRLAERPGTAQAEPGRAARAEALAGEGLRRDLARHPQLGIRTGPEGTCLVARRRIGAAETVLAIGGERVSTPSRYSLQIGRESHLWSATMQADDYMDHSCEPNCRIEVRGDEVLVTALRTVHAGEKLTFNYLTTEWDLAEPFVCRCGSPGCFGRIAGFRHLSPADQARLEPLVIPYLRRA